MAIGPKTQSLPPTWIRAVISVFVVAHFLAILLCYSANWRKSETKEGLIRSLQPYLIGFNWYVEIFPVEWEQIGPTGGSKTRLVLRQADNQTTVFFQSDSTRSDRERERQLLGIMMTLAEGGEDDGTALLLDSILRRAERELNQTFVGLSLERKATSDESFQTIYRANIVRLDGSVRLVPVLEPQRTVLSLANAGGSAP